MKNWPRVEEGKMVKVGVSPPADERSKSIRLQIHVQTGHGNCKKSCPQLYEVYGKIHCGVYRQLLTVTAKGNFVRTHGCVADFGP